MWSYACSTLLKKHRVGRFVCERMLGTCPADAERWLECRDETHEPVKLQTGRCSCGSRVQRRGIETLFCRFSSAASGGRLLKPPTQCRRRSAVFWSLARVCCSFRCCVSYTAFTPFSLSYYIIVINIILGPLFVNCIVNRPTFSMLHC